VVAACALVLLFGCEAVLGLGDLHERPDALGDNREAGSPLDGGGDTSPLDGSLDASGDGALYNDLADRNSWDVCDLGLITKDATHGFTGGAFDGRFLYLAPMSNQMLRLDTTMVSATGSLCNGPAWTPYKLVGTPADGGPILVSAYAGSVYDGQRYVYFVPSVGITGGLAHIALRYDTRGVGKDPFTSATSWVSFDTSAHIAHAHGFIGGVFDGRYVYFVPNGDTYTAADDPNGVVVRYDTLASGGFEDPLSWSDINLVTLLPEAPTQFAGGLYLAPYVYFIPQFTQYVTRYDTRLPFNVPTSWATYDVTTGAVGSAYGYAGGAIVGTQLYFAPYQNAATTNYLPYSTVLSYDSTTDDFTNSGAWTKFDTKPVPSRPSGFYGAVADGRFLYFAPDEKNIGGPDGSTISVPSANMARFDTTGPFLDGGSWQSFNIESVTKGAIAFAGAIFDGTHVYFPPSGLGGSFMARFRARNAPQAPPFTPSFL
jgi:hypothetical protein